MKRIEKISIGAGILFFLAVLSTFLPFPKAKLSPGRVVSLKILDRNGLLLREVLSDEGGRCRWVGLGEISPYLVQATIATEDRLFFFHRGVNPASTLRALWQNLRQGRVISGASTITQQVVRSLYPRRRNLFLKLREIWLAARLENSTSKEEILTQYLNRIFYANQAYGIEAASRLYFAKPAAHLSLAEAAFLANIPRSPALLDPYRSFSLAKEKQRDILRKMCGLGYISKAEAQRALRQEIRIVPAREQFRAPHFCDMILGRLTREERETLISVRTTLDYVLQRKVEVLVRGALDSLADRGISNFAVVVVENSTGDVLSLVGSGDFFADRTQGQVNGATALRQPGSALKPFTYALALENGLTAATRIEDSAAQWASLPGGYMPRNYDRRYHGPVSLRQALACSYNIPAVAVLDAIGPDLLYLRLKSLGFESLKESPAYYGIGLSLGNGEVTLLELVRAYSVLGRQGLDLPLRTVMEKTTARGERMTIGTLAEGRRLFSPQVAFLITHILADRDARIPSFGYQTPLALPFPCAAKTGTTKDFRDNWTIGYTPRFTVGVWAGNFDGSSMRHVSGITGCGPLFRDVMLLLHQDGRWPEFLEPEGLIRKSICPLSGKLPGKFCTGTVEEIFIAGTEPKEVCPGHKPIGEVEDFVIRKARPLRSSALQIISPRNGDVFRLDPVLRGEHQQIKLKIAVPDSLPVERVEWWVNGRKIGQAGYPYSLFWKISPGSCTIQGRAVCQGKTLETQPVRITVLSSTSTGS